MRLPSLEYILHKSLKTLKRFPLTIFSAIVATAVLIYLAEVSVEEGNLLYNLLLVAILGIPLFTAVQLISEQRSWNRPISFIVSGVAFLLLLLFYLWLPHSLSQAPDYHFYRYGLYFLGIHLLVAIGPFLGQGSMTTFWHYNKTLLLRFLTAIFFTGALNIGLSIALLSIDALLGVHIEEIRYFQLFAFLAGIFNTWFFLSGIPVSFKAFSISDDYPKGLKVFTQNVLLPLVVIYLAILYLYTGKILIQWDWPEGWVSNLILSFSIAGILSILLLYPIQDRSENRWIKQFSKNYFWSLIPLVILLLLAIYRRVWEYGFTVERYFVLVAGLWLAVMVSYFILSREKNIKIIPASLCLVTILISFGPWSAFSISEQSQVNRLEVLLQQNDLLENQVIQKTSAPLKIEERQEISNIVHYLVATHGIQGIQHWFKKDLTDAEETNTGKTTNYEQANYIVSLMGVEYASPSRNDLREQKRFTSANQNFIPVENFNWLVPDLSISNSEDLEEVVVGGQQLVVKASAHSLKLTIYFKDDSRSTLTIDTNELVSHLIEAYPYHNNQIPAEEMTVSASNEKWEIKAYIRSILWEEENDKRLLKSLSFDLLISNHSD